MSRRTPWPVAVQAAAALSMWVLALGLIGIHPLLSLPWGLVAAGVAEASIELKKPEQMIASGPSAEARRVEVTLQ